MVVGPALPLVDHNRCTYTVPDVLIGCSSETSALLLIFLNDTTLLSLTTLQPFLLTIREIFFASCLNPFIRLPNNSLLQSDLNDDNQELPLRATSSYFCANILEISMLAVYRP